MYQRDKEPEVQGILVTPSFQRRSFYRTLCVSSIKEIIGTSLTCSQWIHWDVMLVAVFHQLQGAEVCVGVSCGVGPIPTFIPFPLFKNNGAFSLDLSFRATLA